MYFGYIGSHATRYSNFILAKSYLIISIGNRMSFPLSSQSFRPIVENKKIIRVDVDNNELLRKHRPEDKKKLNEFNNLKNN